ncbi:MAG: DUF4268 domain-containing protein [Magnetococcales bacterium]|nr:DUF4268 domain-containing protein [Magnetococcales bacterium]
MERVSSVFDQLYQARDEIEKQFGRKLNWEPLPGTYAKRVAVYIDGPPNDPKALLDKQDKLASEIVGLMGTFRDVFAPRLQVIMKPKAKKKKGGGAKKK